MVQIQEAGRSDLMVHLIAAAARDHGPAVFVLGASDEDLLIVDAVLRERLGVELVSVGSACVGRIREHIAGAHGYDVSRIRSADTLDAALFGKHAWITSRRAAPGNEVAPYEYDATHGALKFNPLAAWNERHVAEALETIVVAAPAPFTIPARPQNLSLHK
jgi:hypothetical protein